ncbi:MAG: RNA polymerase sigma-70 factor [Prolixibacteraceae bacterium]
MEIPSDKDLFLAVKNSSEVAFEQLFHRYYAALCLFTSNFLHDREKADEIVQEVFVKVWARRETLEIASSVRNYLFFAVRNKCINLLEHEKVEKRHSRQAMLDSLSGTDLEPYFMEVDLRRKIEQSIELLPEKRREIFKLSREGGLKYQEIAQRLNISLKTVETQMGLALKQLREMLRDYKDYL